VCQGQFCSQKKPDSIAKYVLTFSLQVCSVTNCGEKPLSIPLQRRLLLWTCPAECDYNCQHVVTDERLARDPAYRDPVLQFHGKWPFHRFLGMQEPFSVLFSLFNYLAHDAGLKKLHDRFPNPSPLVRYYRYFGYFGKVTWIFSMLFHTRDFPLTEKLDYFAAGASVLYGLYLCVIRVLRLDQPTRQNASLLRLWTAVCLALYTAHVAYLSLWSWDYTYNMAANVVVGAATNLIWSWFSFNRYKTLKKLWATWPGMIVAWIVFSMSLELFDFPPWQRMIDAHSLWHLSTSFATYWWYLYVLSFCNQSPCLPLFSDLFVTRFLIKDATEVARQHALYDRLKA
jgi:hypothetical protein